MGAFVVGSPETAAAKMRHINDSLGGVSQVSLMMSGGPLSHDKMLRAIELLGAEVKPRVEAAAMVSAGRAL
jgi:alkanesulfonate monooxygenase SsuD/methylene tetrahydromethanopterin reductase-like flavin-dependent oxidoreductase (luciferase family)